MSTPRQHHPGSFLGLPPDGRDLYDIAAHKLNTPVANLRGFVATLVQRGDRLDPATMSQFHQIMLAQTDRLQRLVRDFLELARVQGAPPPAPVTTSPRDLAEDLLSMLDEEQGFIRLTGSLDTKVTVDPDAVRSALRPLVENALAHGPEGGPVTITVTTRPGWLRWSVHDPGTRLDGEPVEPLYVPFFRGDDPAERRPVITGAGLGLTLCRSWAELLGGTAGGCANQDGTVFWFELPLSDERRPS